MVAPAVAAALKTQRLLKRKKVGSSSNGEFQIEHQHPFDGRLEFAMP